MDSLIHSLLDLVEANKNDVKSSLKGYIDYTVDAKFEQMKNLIISMAAHNSIPLVGSLALDDPHHPINQRGSNSHHHHQLALQLENVVQQQNGGNGTLSVSQNGSTTFMVNGSAAALLQRQQQHHSSGSGTGGGNDTDDLDDDDADDQDDQEDEPQDEPEQDDTEADHNRNGLDTMQSYHLTNGHQNGIADCLDCAKSALVMNGTSANSTIVNGGTESQQGATHLVLQANGVAVPAASRTSSVTGNKSRGYIRKEKKAPKTTGGGVRGRKRKIPLEALMGNGIVLGNGLANGGGDLVGEGKKKSKAGRKPKSYGSKAKPFLCTYQNCGNGYFHQGDVIRHIRHTHFELPRTVREQKLQNITDARDPYLYIRKVL